MRSFPAIIARGNGPATLESITDADLPDDPVTVDVAFSSLNYKDGLAVTGKGKIARSFPMICGIDLAGTVASSSAPDWPAGTDVVVTGYGLSETHGGGFTQRQRLRPEWLIRRPESMSLADTMSVGTAGLTAMLSVLELERHGLSPEDGDVLVTGAAGGVGSMAIAILAARGYRVTASTGRPETGDYLTALGAGTIVDRAELAAPGRPLDKERWAAAVDSVGSTTLATVLSQIRYGGAVAACGLAGGSDLPTTVLPHILRGVALLGIDSVQCPADRRRQAWDELARTLPAGSLATVTTIEAMSSMPALAEAILAGQIRGRVVIDPAR
jgi:putative YhdH/YhfP family quinone oxidoreductase